MDCNVIDKNIETYLDGELTLSDRRDFEEHIEACPGCAGKLENLRALQNVIRKTGYSNVPSSLQRNIQSGLRDITGEDHHKQKLFNWLGLGGGSLVFGSLTTWVIMTFLITAPLQVQFADEVIAAHVRSLMVDHVTDVKSSDRHTVKPWFNGRTDFSPPVHDLKSAGYELIGGRLDYLNGKAVSALVYKRRAHIINTFIFRSSAREKVSKTEIIQRQGYNLMHWAANGLDYWIISDLNQKELSTFSQLLTDSHS